MDLTNLAQNAAAAEKARQEAAAVEQAELQRLNDATDLRNRFKNVLGIDVAESELIWDERYRRHGVIVDGVALALGVASEPDSLYVFVFDGSDLIALDVSMTVRQPIKSLSELGRILEPHRRHNTHGHGTYVPGVGLS